VLKVASKTQLSKQTLMIRFLNTLIMFIEKLFTNPLSIFKKDSVLTAELKIYESAIKYLADNQNNFIIPNSGKEHATIIMSNIFRTSKNYVYIFAGNLGGEVSNSVYIENLIDFLERDGTYLEVILEEKPQIKSEAIRAILEHAKENPEKVKITYATNKESLRQSINEEEIRHFTFADDRMYRLEVDTKKFIAQANFNDEATVVRLKEKFKSIKNIELSPVTDELFVCAE
jgi:hypothetical protein